MSEHTMIDTWGECNHASPDNDDGTRFPECKDTPVPHEPCWDQRVKCRHYTEYSEALDEYEALHDSGEGIDGDHVTLCYEKPMGRYCKECSYEQGDWTGHLEPEKEDDEENNHE